MKVSTKLIGYILFACTFCMSMSANAAKKASDILGVWQTYDDKTGNPKAQVTIRKSKKDNSYYGSITKVTPAAGYKPKKYCQNCPKPFTNKKIEGMMIMWNMKPLEKNGRFKGYDDGYVIDPLSGKIYRFRAQLSSNKKILKTRAYKGVSLMGRSQTWRRIK